MLARAAAMLVRLPLAIAAIVAAILATGLDLQPTFHFVARIAVRILLAAYLLAGLANLPRFPRTVRGPVARRRSDVWLLDAWTLVALLVGVAIAIDGTWSGLL